MTSTTLGVSLRIPAHERFIASARVLAASLAADLEMSVDEIEELRIGIDEALSLLIDAVNRNGTVELAFDVDADGLGITATTSEVPSAIDPDDLSQHILAAVVDRFEIGDDVIRLRKQRSRP